MFEWVNNNAHEVEIGKRRTTAKIWLGLQDDYDIEEEQEKKKEILNKIKTERCNKL